MASKVIRTEETMVEAIGASLDFAARAGDGVVPPVAVLWTDADGQWRSALPALQSRIPHIYALGEYQPDDRMGPVIWLKCVIERTLPDCQPAPDIVPILYLPNVSRQELRAGGDCPQELMPLVELQYRGVVWHQRSGRDWTVEAFVTSEDGIGLKVAADGRTREAMHRSLPVLVIEPLTHLRGHGTLHAEDFDRLSVDDPVRDVLSWMNGHEQFRKAADETRWAAFRSVCRDNYGFDPELDAPSVPAAGIVNADPEFEEVWKRFSEAPQLYPALHGILGQVQRRDLLSGQDRSPLVNAQEEVSLREQFGLVANMAHHEACSATLELEKRHGVRRAWVWARLGQAPLAAALECLASLAKHCAKPLSAPSIVETIHLYASGGWEADRAALEAMVKVTAPADIELVGRAVKAIYATWLDQTARQFQALVSAPPDDFRVLAKPVDGEKGACVLFADGLRFDVGGMLQEVLEGRGAKVHMAHRVAPLPTVTATGKPFASPAHEAFSGTDETEDFLPVVSATGEPVNADRLRKIMATQGVDVIETGQIRIASNVAKGGWAEIGEIDRLGHDLDARLVGQIRQEVEAIADRVMQLLQSGWSHVRIVTDHGWLLLPGDLPKIELPPYLVVRKGHRAAAIKAESSTKLPTYPWHWNPKLFVVSPPGIGVFYADIEYAHGGVTLQECVIPDITVELMEQPQSVGISKVEWTRLRCRVSLEGEAEGLTVDIRLKRNDPKSIADQAKRVGKDGRVTLVVEDPDQEGAGAVLVVLDQDGRVLKHVATTVGEG